MISSWNGLHILMSYPMRAFFLLLLLIAKDFVSKIIILTKQSKICGDMYYTLVIWAKNRWKKIVFSLGNLAFLYCLYAVAFLSFVCSRLCILLGGYPSYSSLFSEDKSRYLEPSNFSNLNENVSHPLVKLWFSTRFL